MKNPHGVEPTRYMKERNNVDFQCDTLYNRRNLYNFHLSSDLENIDDIFINEKKCMIRNDGKHGYECHPEYKSSLFVNTAGPDEENKFTVLDYEVYIHN